MIDSYLLKITEKYFGVGDTPSKGNISFYCPFCNHKNKKLNIQFDTSSDVFGSWHCWVCNASGKSIIQLFKKHKVNDEVIKEVKKYIKTELGKSSGEYEPGQFTLKLPDEFLPLYKKRNTPEYKNALHYILKIRQLSMYDIVRYNIGYCETGEYQHRVIIPSYDEIGNLNFFTGRSYISDEPRKYNTPSISKNFIGFDLFINWHDPIILLEGPFDAIAYRRNAIPLFGKQLSDALRIKIIQQSVKIVKIGLDPDAILTAIKYIEDFHNQGISVHLLQFGDKDPADTGYLKLMEINQNSKPMKTSDILKLKLRVK